MIASIHETTSGIEAIPLFGQDLTDALEQLFDRVNSCISDPGNFEIQESLLFDTVDLGIFDNNLAHLEIKGARLTAESIVGYVRAFTTCPYSISLNKNPDVDFDLRYLIGDYETRADLSLNAEHLENKALWTGNLADAKEGFRPWYWPTLSLVCDRRRAQIEVVEKNLDESIFRVLGFPTDEEALGFLSLHAKGALSPDASVHQTDGHGLTLENLTFRDIFISRGRSLPASEERGNIAKVESPLVRQVIARVVAADVDLWFRRDVAAPQEMLVDVPHLLTRMPFLLGTEVVNPEAWNKAAVAIEPPFGMDSQLYSEHLEKARYQQGVWLATPAFWWPELKRNEVLGDLFFTSSPETWADVVFCEDTSLFVARESESPPTEFPAEFEGAWARRYVAKLGDFKYKPQSRLLL
ncbi:MAG TPA: hypothetical protein VFJ82_09395 [Longimicrobium sp.]|nr:hypothetical protein [Longimicrobium sp.]